MTIDHHTRVNDTKNDLIPVPMQDKTLHDSVESMQELRSIIAKVGVSGASLENLATGSLYGRHNSDIRSGAIIGNMVEPPLFSNIYEVRKTASAVRLTGQENAASMRQESVTSKSQENVKAQDATKPTDASKPQDVATEHQRLSDWADKNLKEPKLSEFKKNMDDFEARAKREGLDPNEVAKTYKQLERLTEATGDKPLSEVQRRQLAEQVLHQAAAPTSIDQGNHNTCSATTVEVRTYSRTPSDAARLVTDVALTGEYKAPDGTHIKVDPKPHDESRSGTNVDGHRSHASEIFQVTAINLYYAKENAKNGTRIHYEQVTPRVGDDGDTGERLVDYAKNPPQEVKVNGTKVVPPDVKDSGITEMSNIITGKKEGEVQIGQAGNINGDSKGIVVVNSEAELKSKLKELKEQHKLPVIIKVSTFNEPFNSDSATAGAGGEAESHVVTITDYDEKTGKVSVDNQWGKSNDHGKDNPVSSHDLYIAMQTPQNAEKAIAADVKYNHDHGISDPAKELDLMRYEAMYGGVNGETIGRTSIENSIHEMQKRWQKGGVSEEEKTKERNALNGLISGMPMEDQAKLMQEEHAAHLSSDGQYMNQLGFLGLLMLHPTKNDPVSDQAKADFKAALGDLSANQQQSVLGLIDKYTHAEKHPKELPAFEKTIEDWMKQNEGK